MNAAGQCVAPEQETSSTTPVSVTVSDRQPVSGTAENRTPADAQQVLGATGTVRAAVARARLQGPRRCVVRPFSAAVRGQGIRRVTLYVNGRKVRTVTGRSVSSLRVDPRAYGTGVVRIAARVEYVAASGKRAQTLRMTVLRCASNAVLPRFAG